MGIWLTLRLPPDPPRVPVDHGACIAHQSADHYAVAGCRARVAIWGLGTCNPMTLVPSARVPAERRVVVALVRCVTSASHGAVIVCSEHEAGSI